MIKLGIIGYSDGNGHPYSWSAIFNGYDKDQMKTCGYPIIPEYLSKQIYPTDFLCNLATVNGIWSQSRQKSEEIAKSTYIPNVYDNLCDLVRNVDAVLLARDDSENHFKTLTQIRHLNKPVYIDKPIATNDKSLDQIVELFADNSQFFSCSAFRFDPKIQHLAAQIHKNPKNVKITGNIPKSWDKYSVHLLDPLVELIPPSIELVGINRSEKPNSITKVNYSFENGIYANITTTGLDAGPIYIKVEYENRIHTINFSDTFGLFKSALEHFVTHYVQNTAPKDITRYHRLVKLISCGL